MSTRSIETTTSLKRKKNQLRQIKNCRIEKTKSYAITYNLRSVATKKKLFDSIARDSLDNVVRKREYKTNEKKKEARIRVKIRLEKKNYCERQTSRNTIKRKHIVVFARSVKLKRS